jgi:hypothetical protein
MGLTWAAAWGMAAVLIGMAVDPDGSMDEMWVAIGAYPGFLGGVVFSAVLAMAARRRRLDELSLPRVAGWGAAAGLLVGSVPFVLGDPISEHPVWLLGGVVIGSITLLSALSAAGSLALARMAERREPLDAGPAGGGALPDAAPSFASNRPRGGEEGPLLTAARPDDLRRERSDRPEPVRRA